MDFVPRSRDVSQPSLGGLDRDDDRADMCSSPPSPLYMSEGTSHGTTGNGGGGGGGGGTGSRTKQGIFAQKSGQPHFRKYQDSSLDADDTESELVAIPESDLSDSTIHGSAPVSLYLQYLKSVLFSKFIYRLRGTHIGFI